MCQISMNKMILHRVKSCLFLAKSVIIQLHTFFICKRENPSISYCLHITYCNYIVLLRNLLSLQYLWLNFAFGSLIQFLSIKKPQSQGTFSFSVSSSVLSTFFGVMARPGCHLCVSIELFRHQGEDQSLEVVVFLCRYSQIAHLQESGLE